MNLLLRKYPMFFPIINDSLNKAHGNDCKCRFIKNRRIWIDFVSLNYRRKCTIEVYKTYSTNSNRNSLGVVKFFGYWINSYSASLLHTFFSCLSLIFNTSFICNYIDLIVQGYIQVLSLKNRKIIRNFSFECRF